MTFIVTYKPFKDFYAKSNLLKYRAIYKYCYLYSAISRPQRRCINNKCHYHSPNLCVVPMTTSAPNSPGDLRRVKARRSVDTITNDCERARKEGLGRGD